MYHEQQLELQSHLWPTNLANAHHTHAHYTHSAHVGFAFCALMHTINDHLLFQLISDSWKFNNCGHSLRLYVPKRSTKCALIAKIVRSGN